MLLKWVENTVGKGEIAHYEQFLLFPWCFQKTCTADKKKNQSLFGKGLTLTQRIQIFENYTDFNDESTIG